MDRSESYDVVVVGAGHAGCEAAGAAARAGLSALLVTIRDDRVGWMSCNPAVGGVGKGQLVKEVDALGGLIGRNTDATGIQFRTLNQSRGPAVRGSRAQCDRVLYARMMRERIDAMERVDVLEGIVADVVVERSSSGGSRVVGVRTEEQEIACTAVVLTTGTFLDGVAHIGRKRTPCGREGERPAVALSRSLSGLGLSLGRFKTGTTPRVDGRTVDMDRVDVQPGDPVPRPFSRFTDEESFPLLEQRPCHVTRTNERTHAIVRERMSESAVELISDRVYSPRYCPSIEEKLCRFPSRRGHTVYIEPDGLESHEVYPAGLTTSLPVDVQLAMLRTIEGFEEVEIVRPGYAIEYDFILPHQLEPTLAVRDVEGLFSAGQINGTSGYEEAAAQGVVAGINAALWVAGEPPLILRRDQAYIGVLISDLTTVGATEPYRMFTSRAEHRLRLREDNADLRLSEEACRAGMISADDLEELRERRRRVSNEVSRLESTFALTGARAKEGRSKVTLATMLRRPGARMSDVRAVDPSSNLTLGRLDEETVEADIQYAGYIDRSRRWLERLSELEDLEIPPDLELDSVPGLSGEVCEKLRLHKPGTVGQASRVDGVTPAAVEILAASVLRSKKACGLPVEQQRQG